MKIHVNIPYFTRWGQRILVSGNVKELGDGDFSKALPLSLNSHENWYGEFECNPPATEPLKYKYLLFDENTGKYTEEWGDNRTVELQKNTDDYYCFDSWNVAGSVENVFMTSPFRKVLLKPGIAALAKAKQPAKYTHKFIVKAPLLKPNQALCIIGNCKQLRNWTVSDPAMMNLRDDEWELKIDLSKATTEIHYKYGVYDAEAGHFLFFEQGPDRIAAVIQNSVVQTNDGFIRVDNQSWHGAGLGLPVFSIRTRKSFGVGDFADLKLLVDWSEKIGMKLIQLLPLNDTTGTHTELDVLPYAAISAFALNPLFLNLP
ncbi:MAG TPA: 4-alpha-glucanotransferase, partial [Paludibacteraceae bacterium]|nr:4-alpha-glucanotransferase [Paludibacteraceae bacterium]